MLFFISWTTMWHAVGDEMGESTSSIRHIKYSLFSCIQLPVMFAVPGCHPPTSHNYLPAIFAMAGAWHLWVPCYCMKQYYGFTCQSSISIRPSMHTADTPLPLLILRFQEVGSSLVDSCSSWHVCASWGPKRQRQPFSYKEREVNLCYLIGNVAHKPKQHR